jgi:hypothetical protein
MMIVPSYVVTTFTQHAAICEETGFVFRYVCVCVCVCVLGGDKINSTLICLIMTVVDTGMFDNMKQFLFSLGTYAALPTEICGF